jgi:UDP:flavonoid glycosyltransferase YjiC (YdhE family)
VSQGPDVVAVEYLPLGPVLERAALVVCHAGAGTTLAALSLGVPLLLLPQGADQFHIAECVERAGAGHRLDLDRCGEQVRTALVDPGLRRGARLIQREIAAMPDVVAAASALEHLSSLGA